jgi:methionyl-tRNA formyltransferase
MNVIFMGTPEFAVPALDALIQSNNHKVAAVFSQQPKAKGRGMLIQNSPVHDKAAAHNISVYTPSSLKTKETLDLIKSISADIIIVIAYGFIIPIDILESKKYGCLNIHPSKLPKYRGAAPLQRTIINGDLETAVCVIQMDEGLDTGDIILQQNFDISATITFQELHDNCSNIGGKLIIQALDNIKTLVRSKQPDQNATYAHKLKKEEGKVNWHDSAFKVDCMVRGMNPWPGVYFEYNGIILKIIESECIKKEHSFNPGTIINEKFEVACGSDVLLILRVQPENKPKMSATDFLRGQNKGNSY